MQFFKVNASLMGLFFLVAILSPRSFAASENQNRSQKSHSSESEIPESDDEKEPSKKKLSEKVALLESELDESRHEPDDIALNEQKQKLWALELDFEQAIATNSLTEEEKQGIADSLTKMRSQIERPKTSPNGNAKQTASDLPQNKVPLTVNAESSKQSPQARSLDTALGTLGTVIKGRSTEPTSVSNAPNAQSTQSAQNIPQTVQTTTPPNLPKLTSIEGTSTYYEENPTAQPRENSLLSTPEDTERSVKSYGATNSYVSQSSTSTDSPSGETPTYFGNSDSMPLPSKTQTQNYAAKTTGFESAGPIEPLNLNSNVQPPNSQINITEDSYLIATRPSDSPAPIQKLTQADLKDWQDFGKAYQSPFTENTDLESEESGSEPSGTLVMKDTKKPTASLDNPKKSSRTKITPTKSSLDIQLTVPTEN